MTIDPDLFQLIVIGLLVVSLLVGLLSLSAASAVRKQLKAGIPQAAAPSPLMAEPASLAAYSPEMSATAAAPMAATPYPAAAVRSEPIQAYQPEPVQAYQAPAQTYQPAPVAAEPTAAASSPEEPQEQPFERDGRWWFRRGAELLVYDEQTTQWVPAPGPTAGGVAAATTTTATLTEGGDAGNFWKCPSCGAVNGSTAAACRMCFTPRS